MTSLVSDEDKQTILRLRIDGLSYGKIAKKVNRAISTVYCICNPKAREKSCAYGW